MNVHRHHLVAIVASLWLLIPLALVAFGLAAIGRERLRHSGLDPEGEVRPARARRKRP
jgi:hypothetical protein